MPHASKAAAEPARDRAFAGPKRPIQVRGAGVLGDELALFVADWPARPGGAEPAEPADIVVAETTAGFTIDSVGPGGGRSRFSHVAKAANGLAGALITAYVTQTPALLCLHASAVICGDGLVLFLGDSEAGKTSLALQLARRGHRFFADDRIALAAETGGGQVAGLCLGLAPKARLPLPPESPELAGGVSYRRFIEDRSIAASSDFAHLALLAGEAAGFAERAPVAALVRVARRAEGKAELAPLGRSDLVRSLIAQAFAPHIDAAVLVARLAAIAAAVPSYDLRFSESAAAAALIARRLGGA